MVIPISRENSHDFIIFDWCESIIMLISYWFIKKTQDIGIQITGIKSPF